MDGDTHPLILLWSVQTPLSNTANTAAARLAVCRGRGRGRELTTVARLCISSPLLHIFMMLQVRIATNSHFIKNIPCIHNALPSDIV